MTFVNKIYNFSYVVPYITWKGIKCLVIILTLSIVCNFINLNDLFSRYQKKCDELEVLRGAFESQKKYEIKNKEDIIAWLEGKLNRSGMSILLKRYLNIRNSSHFGTWSFQHLVKSAPKIFISAPSSIGTCQ